jgi:hypothetical protein
MPEGTGGCRHLSLREVQGSEAVPTGADLDPIAIYKCLPPLDAERVRIAAESETIFPLFATDVPVAGDLGRL